MSFVEASISDRGARISTPSRSRPALGQRIRSEADANVVFAQTAVNRVDLIERLSIGTIQGGDFAITHIARKRPGHGMTNGAAKRESYVACVHLEKLDAYDIWCDEEHESPGPLEAGALHVNDMRHAWRVDVRSPFHVVNFCVPQSAFDEITSEEGGAPIAELHCPMSLARVDTVLRNFAMALFPALAKPDQANKLFIDLAARAVTAHLARC
jgi:AraC family transcriptional regulator